MDGVFQLDRRLCVYLTHAMLPWIRAGVGIRIGARIRLVNAHVVYSDADVTDLAICAYGGVEIVELASDLTLARPWQRPPIARWTERLNLPHTIQLCRAPVGPEMQVSWPGVEC